MEYKQLKLVVFLLASVAYRLHSASLRRADHEGDSLDWFQFSAAPYGIMDRSNEGKIDLICPGCGIDRFW